MLRRLLNRLVSPGRAPEADAAASAQDAANRLIDQGNRAETEGNLDEACAQYRQAVAAAPGHARAHLNLGTGLEATGNADGAIRSYETALTIDPANAYASYNLGRMLYARGELARARALLRSALEHKPGFPEGLVALSNVYDAQGNLDAAAAALQAALVQRPEWTGALLNYAGILRKLGRLTEAEAALRRVMAIEPGNADAIYALANLHYARGALQDAEQLLRLALEHRPVFPDAFGTLFDVYDAQGKLDAAAAALEAALGQRPDWAAALHNYGVVLKKLHRLAEAEAALRRAITIAPEMSLAHEALGGILFNQGRIADALASFRAARDLDPDRLDVESAELLVLSHSDEITGDALFARHKALGARLEQAHPPRFESFQNAADPGRRLRIGYVSGDFNHHPVTFFLLPLLERHDRSAFEIVCYSAGTVADEFTRQVQARADIWREVAPMSSTELADTINRDGIDILVDLSGHSGASRLTVFAQRPAPVQVAWLGYPNTTGLTRIQYRICDGYTDPPGATEHLHTEALLRLPHSQWCYRPFIVAESSAELPFERNGYVTFGSFNQMKKLSPSARKLWAEILTRLPDARLVMAGVPERGDRERMLRDFGNAGVTADRVMFLPHVAAAEYFRRFNDVDIALDPTPYSGCTTTFDTLWMGVPVITLCGATPASRVTAGILTMMDLLEWRASTPEDYVQRAVKFARDGALLKRLRITLRQRLRESPIMDESRFALDIEDACRHAWRAWCGGNRQ